MVHEWSFVPGRVTMMMWRIHGPPTMIPSILYGTCLVRRHSAAVYGIHFSKMAPDARVGQLRTQAAL
jgi:hypothetical protein